MGVKRKSEAMRELYGTGEGTCADCSHFQKFNYRDKSYQKCDIYGITNSNATDWRQKYLACGLKNQEWHGDRPVIEFLKSSKREQDEIQVDGQISFFGGCNE